MTKKFMHKNLLRNDQIVEAKSELQRMEHMLVQPGLQDRGEMLRQKRSVEQMLKDGEPVPFSGDDIDAAVARESELRDQITAGMPTAAEMRHAPPGVIGKHRQWERQNKAKIQEWKYLRRRMYSGSDDPDVSNIERYRPRSNSSAEGNLDGGIVERKSQIFVPQDAVNAVTMSDVQEEVLAQIDPDLLERMALLDADKRQAVLDVVNQVLAGPAKPEGGISGQPQAEGASADKMFLGAAGAEFKEPEYAYQENEAEGGSTSALIPEIDGDQRGKHMRGKTPEERKALGRKLAEARAAAKAKREAEQQEDRMAEAVAN